MWVYVLGALGAVAVMLAVYIIIMAVWFAISLGSDWTNLR